MLIHSSHPDLSLLFQTADSTFVIYILALVHIELTVYLHAIWHCLLIIWCLQILGAKIPWGQESWLSLHFFCLLPFISQQSIRHTERAPPINRPLKSTEEVRIPKLLITFVSYYMAVYLHSMLPWLDAAKTSLEGSFPKGFWELGVLWGQISQRTALPTDSANSLSSSSFFVLSEWQCGEIYLRGGEA